MFIFRLTFFNYRHNDVHKHRVVGYNDRLQQPANLVNQAPAKVIAPKPTFNKVTLNLVITFKHIIHMSPPAS